MQVLSKSNHRERREIIHKNNLVLCGRVHFPPRDGDAPFIEDGITNLPNPQELSSQKRNGRRGRQKTEGWNNGRMERQKTEYYNDG
jgi:hypothetical protein